MYSKKFFAIIFYCLVLPVSQSLCATTITGDLENPGNLKKWHMVEITFDGPSRNETNAATFTDYRLDVRFTPPGGPSFWVPGFFAADGDAADSGTGSGNKWRVHLCPHEEGTWQYEVSFITGSGVAYPTSLPSGTPVSPHGETGSFVVGPSDKDPSGRDHRAKGMLFYVDKHHMQFGETGEFWIMGGPGSPEDIMGFQDFDNTSGHNWNGHSGDYDAGDASAYTWKSGKGKNLLGAIKYISEERMNSLYIIVLTAPQGDTKTSFPWISTASGDREKYDVSKLEQWERVFSYMDKKGIHLHLLLSETENDSMICGNFGTCNKLKLYYRELVARFSHHHGVLWDIGEEYDGGCNDIKSKADYIRAIDPYDHPITCHTHSNKVSNRYSCLFGHSSIEATSNQHNCGNVKADTQYCKNNSVSAGHPYCVYSTETRDPLCRCSSSSNNMNNARRLALWGNLMGGGAGIEWYFGYASGGWNDINCNDWHIAHCVWDDTKHALDFFMARSEANRKPVPFQNMSNADGRVTGAGNWCLYGQDDDGKPCLVVYMDDGGSTSVNAPAAQKYKAGWMNAKTGAWQYASDISSHPGGNINFTAPSADEWALLLYDWPVEKNPPTPNPAQWETEPTATGEREITMTAVEGTDAESPPVEYYFKEISGNCKGNDSGWQTNRTYIDTDLAPGTQYTHKVKMRDQAGNETGWSSEANATTQGVADTDPPTPDPAQFDELPYALSQTAIAMSAVEGTDLHGPVEYYFDETSGNPGGTDSGWQTDLTYTDTDLQTGTQYTYSVKMRDTVCNETQPVEQIIVCTRPDIDIVEDGQINWVDLYMLCLRWLEDDCCLYDLCQYTDLDASGWIDFADFAILAENWMTFLGPSIIITTYNPIDDAYVQDSTGYNNQQLKVQPSSPTRISYLKFNVIDLPDNYEVASVELELTENGDPGNGTLRFYRGSHNNWTEETIDGSNAPNTQDQVGSRSGSVGSNQTVTVDVTPLVTANAVYTIIITMDAGGNDIWFGSKESSKVPKLTVTAQR